MELICGTRVDASCVSNCPLTLIHQQSPSHDTAKRGRPVEERRKGVNPKSVYGVSARRLESKQNAETCRSAELSLSRVRKPATTAGLNPYWSRRSSRIMSNWKPT